MNNKLVKQCQYSRCKQEATEVYDNDTKVCHKHKEILETNDRRYQKRMERFLNNKYFKN